jgi:hypothetical protein
MPVEFGELPPADPRSYKDLWRKEAEALKARPGEWARITTKPSLNAARTMGSNIAGGILKAFRPPKHFEARSRGLDVWARYVGDGQS